MIVAAGLSPAWQHILRFDALRVGQVNRASESRWCGSGKVLNVGIALAHLGARCQVIAPLGAQAEEAITIEFEELDVAGYFVITAQPTRVCTTLLDAATQTTTELVENASPLASAELDRFVLVYREWVERADVVVLSGSLPAATPTTLYRDLLADTKARVVIDAQGPELLAALEFRPLMVKPNREELARTLSRPLTTDQELLSGMRELNARGAQWVVVSQGRQAVWVTSPSEVYRLEPPAVEQIINPIGCGDCLAAGMAWGLQQRQEPIEAVRLGMAAAAENLGELLPARLTVDKVLSRLGAIRAERIS